MNNTNVVIDEQTTRVCLKCSKAKPIACFYRSVFSSDKLSCWCQPCDDKHSKMPRVIIRRCDGEGGVR